jgi:hypothetical protein
MTGTNVTVVGPRGVADLTLPAEVPLAVVMPEIVAMLAAPSSTGPPAGWVLTRAVGGWLNLNATPAGNRVDEGTVLLLTDDASAAPEPVVRDLVEAVEDAADQAPRWTPAATRIVAVAVAVAAMLALLVGTATLTPAPTVVVLTIAVLMLVITLRVAGSRLERWPAGLLAVAVIALGAGIGRALTALIVLPDSAAVVCAAAGALLAAGVAGWAHHAATLPATTTAVAAVVGVGWGAALLFGASPPAIAAVAGYVVLLAAGLIPTAAAGLGGVLGLSDTAGAERVKPVAGRVAAASGFVAALLWATCLVAAVSIAFLADANDPYATVLALLLGSALLLGARAVSVVTHILAPTLAGLVGLALVALRALTTPGTPRMIALIAVGMVAVVAVAVALLRLSPIIGTQTKRWLGRLETLVLFACPIPILGVLGVYHRVATWFG